MKCYYYIILLLFKSFPLFSIAGKTSLQSDSLIFSKQSGFYQTNFLLNISTNDTNLNIHYTTNGSIPKHKDSIFKFPLLISNQYEQESLLSTISTSQRWEHPKGLIYKGTIIRVRAFKDTIPVTPVYSKTYFVNNQRKYTCPVISIITDSLNLFQEDSGIYLAGNNMNYSQRGIDWERLSHLEYFDIDGNLQLKQNIGLRIHGNKGRTFPQKSMRLYARSEYGKSDFNYRFFLDKPTTSFKRLLLRSASSNDWKNTLFKNELAQELTSSLNLSHQAAIPVIVFINGEYWGIHHLSERVDKHYLNEYYDVNKDSLDLLSNNGIVEEGDADDFLSLINYMTTHCLKETTPYEYVSERVDISNFIDYNISQIFLSNTDWPNNNVKFWKAKDNGKWRWIMSDCDECMSYEKYTVLGDFLNEKPYHEYFPEWSTLLLHNLLKNESFKEQFRIRFENLLLNNFSTTNILNTVTFLKNTYSDEVLEHISRWNTPATFSDWEEAVKGLNAFAALRPIEMKFQLKNTFHNPMIIFPNPATQNIHLSLLVESKKNIYLNLYTLTGKCISKHKYKNKTEFNNTTLNISNLKSGVYMLEVEINNYKYLNKIIIE